MKFMDLKEEPLRFITDRIDHLILPHQQRNKKLFLHYGDLTDSSNLIGLINKIQPDEIYNLGAMSHVHVSFETPEYTANVDAIGTLRILEAIRILNLTKKTRLYKPQLVNYMGRY